MRLPVTFPVRFPVTPSEATTGPFTVVLIPDLPNDVKPVIVVILFWVANKTDPVTDPVTSPVRLPVTSPVRLPVKSPVRLPVTLPVRSPVTSPVTFPVRFEVIELNVTSSEIPIG